jgi:predicted secreted Zn-dependent protease
VRIPGTAVLLLASAPALADRNDFALEYFTIAGTTPRELSADIDAKGPIGENGLRSDGYTRWFIKWHFDLDSDARSCRASNIQVDLDIHMILPKWDPPRAADPALVTRWNRYLDALRLHEDGHRHRAEATAGDVRRALQRESGARDCDALTSRLNATANTLLAGLRAQQAAYDHDTDSGRKQGVRRP